MDSVDKNEEKWVGIEEAANHLGVNKDTIRNWIKKENGIPAHKIGKLWKFKLSELDEWVKSGKSVILLLRRELVIGCLERRRRCLHSNGSRLLR